MDPLTHHKKVVSVPNTNPPSTDVIFSVNLPLVEVWLSIQITKVCNVVLGCLITFTVRVQIKKWHLIFVKLNQRWWYHF